MSNKEKVIVLGSTGSIGDTAIAEITRFRDRFEIVGISCNSNYQKLKNIADRFNVSNIAIEKFHPTFCSTNNSHLEDTNLEKTITTNFKKQSSQVILDKNINCFYGENSSCNLIKNVECDTVVIAISGVASIPPTIESIKLGRKIILASKEVIVTCGNMVFDLCQQYNATILPLDSEHNAMFQCLTTGIVDSDKFNNNICNLNSLRIGPSCYRNIKSLIITASGGKFFNQPLDVMKNATLNEVLQHPKWNMGRKITVDSSTMANKGLEVIEAKYLFNVAPNNIKVVIHPQCVIHSMVEFTDYSCLAQMSQVSMKYAMRYCLFFPERCHWGDIPQNIDNERLDLVKLSSLDFFDVDYDKFPCLKLAFDAANLGICYEIAFNAANDIAVERFLKRQISICEIPDIIDQTLQTINSSTLNYIDDCLEYYNYVTKFSSEQ